MAILQAVIGFISGLPPIWGGVVGGLVVFVLTQGATAFWRFWDDRRQRKAVRRLIKHEAAANMYRLRLLRWSLRSQEIEWQNSKALVSGKCITKTIHLDAQKDVFTALIKDLPHAYSPRELEDVLMFYGELSLVEQDVAKHFVKGNSVDPHCISPLLKRLKILHRHNQHIEEASPPVSLAQRLWFRALQQVGLKPKDSDIPRLPKRLEQAQGNETDEE